MNFKNKKQGYTLAEIMLVILVLTIIFAAMAPIFTKRKITQFTGKHNVWKYIDRANFDATYNPGDPTLTGQLFFGITPTDPNSVTTEFVPLSKTIIRAGEVTHTGKLQRHIQFRYGRSNSNKNGTFAGTWYVNRKNVLLGGGYKDLNFNESSGARDNVAVGYSSLTKLVNGQGNVAIGYRALSELTNENDNVVVGSSAAYKNTKGKNVFIGSQAGYNSTGEKNVAIGYRAGLGAISQSQNLIVGAYAGGGVSSNAVGFGNTAIGYAALGKLSSGEGNIAIGYNALGNLTSGKYNIAIGYNACGELEKGSFKTCIGYNSGPKKKSSSLRVSGSRNKSNSGSAYLLWSGTGDGSAINDEEERVYIGGTPRNYGGDAILEIHNVKGIQNEFGDKNKSGMTTTVAGKATTIINGNLIVRGRPYFTVGNNLHHFHNDTSFGDADSKRYRYYGFIAGDSKYAQCTGDPYKHLSNWDAKCPNFKTTSDRRLKNINDRNYAGLKELKKLKVYNFTFKDDNNKQQQVGVMAQELQKVFPNSVFKDKNGYLKIRWDEMFYATINAIKELDKKIVSLVKRATKVETQITKLEKENLELKAQIENLTIRVNKLKAQ